MSEETHEGKKVVEVEGPSKPRRRRRSRKTGDGSSKAETQQSSDASEPTNVAASQETASASGASSSEQAGEGAPKPKSRRRRRKSRSKRQSSGEASKDGSAQQQQESKKSASSKPSASGKQSSSRRSQGKGDQSRSKQQSRSRQRPRSQSRANVYKPRTPESKFGGREPLITPDFEEERSNEPLELTPFNVFCTYHLGISDDNRYRPANIREVARRFAVSQGELEQALMRYGLSRDNMRKIGYDISLAQLDMQVAPEGIDKRELAKVLFSELVEMSPEVEKSVAEATQAASQGSAEQRVED